MNKIEIEVPKEIRYISEWTDFNTDLLKGHSIINKTITGCGFTHYSLTNNIPTILCSPRKFLLENKHEQHPDTTYLVINSGEKILGIDGTVESNVKKKVKELQEDFFQPDNFEIIETIKTSLATYLFNCKLSSQTPKILVTYDSLKYVLETVGIDLINYSIIVDEFQNIFMDSSFKAEVELNFLEELTLCPNVTYLSATPFIEEYLNELDEFKNLPYYELKWDPCRLRTIEINPKKTSSISKEVDKIINNYRSGNFPIKIDSIGKRHESTEVVFYVNSVKMIRSIIIRNNLTPDQVNIICANTKSNQDALKKIGHSIGKAPGIGQSHKMFTFCTRTTYVGADFYSTSAYSVIVSDCKIDSLTSDIRMDFPQIMGRQRLKENVFRNECTFIFSLADNSITMEQFEEIKNKKLQFSYKDLENFRLVSESGGFSENLLFDVRSRIKNLRYSMDYTGISVKEGKLVINKLVYLSEKRAFELRSNVYKSTFSIYEEFDSISEGVSLQASQQLSSIIHEYMLLYSTSGNFSEKMKIICNMLLDDRVKGRISIADIPGILREHRNYFYLLGPEKIKALGYYETELKRELNNVSRKSETLVPYLIDKFKIGERYTLKFIKSELKLIYESLGITKTPKASDLEEYFNVRSVKFYDSITKKRDSGYEIISLKE